jgi:hypothetical protein
MESYLQTSLVCVVLSLAGCTADLEETNDSMKMNIEVPKIETNESPDLNPATDDDIDVDTPLPGDH